MVIIRRAITRISSRQMGSDLITIITQLSQKAFSKRAKIVERKMKRQIITKTLVIIAIPLLLLSTNLLEVIIISLNRLPIPIRVIPGNQVIM